MTRKIEEVARAIREADLQAYLIDHPGSSSEIVTMAQESMRHQYDAMARAAIKAMREPTKAMQKAIPAQEYTIEHYHGTGHHRTFPTLGSGPLSVWHSMIDAALQEEGE